MGQIKLTLFFAVVGLNHLEHHTDSHQATGLAGGSRGQDSPALPRRRAVWEGRRLTITPACFSLLARPLMASTADLMTTGCLQTRTVLLPSLHTSCWCWRVPENLFLDEKDTTEYGEKLNYHHNYKTCVLEMIITNIILVTFCSYPLLVPKFTSDINGEFLETFGKRRHEEKRGGEKLRHKIQVLVC